jgi:hypothetical protein
MNLVARGYGGAQRPPSYVEKGTDMTVNPESVGEPPEEADEYLKEANADDPRTDPGPPAHEPAGPQDTADPVRRSETSD